MADGQVDAGKALAQGRDVLAKEIRALEGVRDRLGDTFVQAVEVIAACTGKVVVCGVGKSGIIGRKLAATFSSTHTPAVFLHAAEALHGDLGLLFPEDVLILISKSGESDEITQLLPFIADIAPTIIAFTGEAESRVGSAAAVVLDCAVAEEADPLGLAPTSSAIASLALGDALAMAVAAHKELTPEAFARSHPAGALGRRLTVRVEHLMHSGEEHPVARPDTGMRDVIVEMTSKGMGAVNIVDADGALLGIITDGDLRRAIQRHEHILTLTAGDIMTADPISVGAGAMAIDALRTMEDRPSQIMVLPVVDPDGRAVGILRLHDIVKAGL